MSLQNEVWAKLWKKQEREKLLDVKFHGRYGVQTCSDDTVPFHFHVKTLQGLSARKVWPVGADGVSHRLSSTSSSTGNTRGGSSSDKYTRVSVSLFSASHNGFKGRTWTGSDVLWQDETLNLQQDAVFHTGTQDQSLYLIIEILLFDKMRDVVLGWSMLPLAELLKLAIDDGDTAAASKLYKLKVYHGSPRCLFFLNQPFEADTRLMSRIGTELQCQLSVQASLLKAVSLMTQDRLYSVDDVLPGMKVSTANNRTGPIQSTLVRPKLLPTYPLMLKKVQLDSKGNVSFDEVEHIIITTMKKLAVEKTGVEDLNIVIGDRKLSVGLHNGHAFIRPPRVIILDVGTGSSSSTASTAAAVNTSTRGAGTRHTSLKGSRRLARQPTLSSNCDLFFKGEVEVSDIAISDEIAIGVLLEYVANVQDTPSSSKPAAKTRFKLPGGRSGSVAESQVISAPIAFGFFSPFPDGDTFDNAINNDREQVESQEVAVKVSLPMMSGVLSAMTHQFLLTTSQDIAKDACDDWLLDFQLVVNLPANRPSQRGSSVCHDTKEHPSLPADVSVDQDTKSLSFQDNTSVLSSDIVPFGDTLQAKNDVFTSVFTSVDLPAEKDTTGLDQQQEPPRQTEVPEPTPAIPLATVDIPRQRKQQQRQQPSPVASLDNDQLDDTLEQVTMTQTFTTSSAALDVAMDTRQGQVTSGKRGERRLQHNVNTMSSVGKQSDFPGGSQEQVTTIVTPIITGFPSSSSSIPRAMLSLLSSRLFQPVTTSAAVVDRIVEVDQLARNEGNLQAENNDSLKTNEIVLQFLAVSKLESMGRQVFFRFRFYHFAITRTESLDMLSADSSNNIHLLRSSRATRAVHDRAVHDRAVHDSEMYGCEARFVIDWSLIGNAVEFVSYFSTALLQVQMFDSESLLEIGTANLPLKHLLRQGRPAVQCSHALDLVTMTTDDDAPYLLGDWTRQGTSHPVSRPVNIKGTLYVRSANIGSPADPTSHGQHSNRVVVVPSKTTDLLSAPVQDGISRPPLVKHRAKKLVDVYPDLREILGTGTKLDGSGADKETALDRKRKLDRMQAVRDTMTSGSSLQTLQSRPVSFQLQRQQLRQIANYRSRIKDDVAINHHMQSITTHHPLHTSLGVGHLVEFKLHNPFSVATTFQIEFEDDELHVVSNSKEWQKLKDSHQISTVVEENMFVSHDQFLRLPELAQSASSPSQKVLLRANEALNIPFKYQRMDTEADTHHDSCNVQAATGSETKKVKVSFVAESTKSPVAILILHIEHRPCVIHHSLYFSHSENSVMKRCIRNASLTPHDNEVMKVHCKSPGVVCQVISEPGSLVQDIYLKAPCNAAPDTKSFIVLLYRDEFMLSPIERWMCTLLATQRMDLSGQIYQSSTASLVLRGSNVSRTVKCFVSDPKLLKVWPSGTFVLAAHSVCDVQLTMQATKVCKTTERLNLVDVDNGDIISSWMIHCNCTRPTITKVSHINIPSTGGKQCNKRIHFKNSYSVKKSFCVATSRQDLLQFKETEFEVDGNATQSLTLLFTPQQRGSKAEILLFINLSEGSNEECLAINVTFT